MPVLFVFVLATFPGESLEAWLPSLSLHEYLFMGDVNLDTGKSNSLFSNRIELPRLDIIDYTKYDTEAKFQALPVTFSLRGRHLEGAVLSLANLRKVDFKSAHLQGARLDGAQLQGALFVLAELPGVYLETAHLQGGVLSSAHLEGASLVGADLRGALLIGSMLPGALLDRAQLQGAWLEGSMLSGSSFDGAALQGASFLAANLQGASLVNANLQSTSFTRADAWLAETRSEAKKNDRLALAKGIKGVRNLAPLFASHRTQCQYYGCKINEVRQLIEQAVPQGELKTKALMRIDKQLGLKGSEEKEMAEAWSELGDQEAGDVEFEVGLAGQLLAAGCTSDGASYVIHGLLQQTALDTGGRSMQPSLAKAFLEQEHCAGAYGLSEDDKARLIEFRERKPSYCVAPYCG